MKVALAVLALGALAACQQRTQQTIGNQFQQTESAIENSADALEAATENATSATARALENEAAEFQNRARAVEKAATTPATGNGAK